VKPSGAPSSTPTVALLIEAKIQLVQEFSTSLTAVALTDNLPAQSVFVKQMALSFGVHHTKVSITRIYDGSARRTQEKTNLRRLQASTSVLVDYDVRVAVDADEEEVVRLQFEAVTTQMAMGSFITEMDIAMNAVLGAGAVISQTPDIPDFDFTTMEVTIVRSSQPSAAPTEEPEVFSFDSDILYSIVGSLAGLGLLAFGAIYIKHNWKAGKVDSAPPADVEIGGQAGTEPVLIAATPMQAPTSVNVEPKEKLAILDQQKSQELADFLKESDSSGSGSEDDEVMQARVQSRVDAAAARRTNDAEEIRVADPTEGAPMDGPGEANEVVDAKTAALDKYLLGSNSESSEDDEDEEEGNEAAAAAVAAAAEPLSAEAKKALLLERIAALDAEISSDSESEIDSEEGKEADAADASAAAAAKKKQTEEEAAQRAMQMRIAILDSELSSDSDDDVEDKSDTSDTSDTSDEGNGGTQADADVEATEAEKVAAHEEAVAATWGDLSSDSDDSV